MRILELTSCVCYKDKDYPAGFICREASEKERSEFLATQTAKISEDSVLAHLQGRVRILPPKSFVVLSIVDK